MVSLLILVHILVVSLSPNVRLIIATPSMVFPLLLEASLPRKRKGLKEDILDLNKFYGLFRISAAWYFAPVVCGAVPFSVPEIMSNMDEIKEIREIMKKRKNIRNVSVIGHVHHGKSTLTDSLVSKTGISNTKAGQFRFTDTRTDEHCRCNTIRSTAISLYKSLPDMPCISQPLEDRINSYLINLVDTPGHVEFSSEVTAALRVTDGALVVVDCVSGAWVHTETFLKQAIAERIKPVLFMNKMDLALLTAPEDLYQTFRSTVENVNGIIAKYAEVDCPIKDMKVDPLNGSVGFGSGLEGWGFTLSQFADIYSEKFKVEPQKLMERLWGEQFYYPKEKKWGDECKPEGVRGFTKYILEPIYKIYEFCTRKSKEEAFALCEKLGVKLTAKEKENEQKQLFNIVMRKWLPAGDALLQMMAIHLPSPVTAQNYRMEQLYEGPHDDEAALGIKNCDPKGPLVMYISKMMPINHPGVFHAFGRVFSGVVTAGGRYRIKGANFFHGKKEDLLVKSIYGAYLMMGNETVSVEDVPCGNICGLAGVDKFFIRNGTITSHENAHKLRAMKFSVSPDVRITVMCRSPHNPPELLDALTRLSKFDSLVQISIQDSGRHVIDGAGELHLNICLEYLSQNCHYEINETGPMVSCRETVTEMPDDGFISRSSNQRNTLSMRAQQIPDALVKDIETGNVSCNRDARARYLADKHQFNEAEARNILCFGPGSNGPNMVVDLTAGVQRLDEIKDFIVAAFQEASKEGVLCGENMRGVRFDILDVNLDKDKSRRNASQIIPTAKRGFNGAMLAAFPRILEPVYLVKIWCPKDVVGNVYGILLERHGVFIDEKPVGASMLVVEAYLPVRESIGFEAHLRGRTTGKAIPQCVFHHWQMVEGDPMNPATDTGQMIASIRDLKGL